VQLGFVIDHSKCIGCHACTVACKAENHVPLGSFRTWVKYTERGQFPEVKRSFAVLRCNQCTDAPCVHICPVRALSKRPDGIVDIDPARCIGCKACMQGCPYDALYLNEDKGTAEKCHFCAHRVEVGLAPACAVVCPTEAIIPGDFHDPTSVVSRMKAEHDLSVRKKEAGTGPNVYYREAAEAGLDPSRTSGAGGYLWAGRLDGTALDAERFLALEAEAEARAVARTTYDVDHRPLWGATVSAYLFTKSLAAGLFLVVALLGLFGRSAIDPRGSMILAAGALVFLGVTSILLVADLARPERFLFVLLRANWSSWLARGSPVLAAYGAVLAIWIAAALAGRLSGPGSAALTATTAILAALVACYTGWLFGQAKGRVLWMRRGLWAHLIVQAVIAGSALALLAGSALGFDGASERAVSAGGTLFGAGGTTVGSPLAAALRLILVAALLVHALLVLTEGRLAPRRRANEYRSAHRLVTHGPFARRHWTLGVGLGILVPLALLPVSGSLATDLLPAVAALVGLWVEEDVLVRAGQAIPIS